MRFLTWNLALLERSAQAPTTWQDFHIEDAIRRFVLDEAPDVVCWQELPGQVPFVETLDLLRASTQSHSGHVATLATHDLAATAPRLTVVDGIGVLTTFADVGGTPLTIANVHLAPGPGGADLRLVQVSKIVEASPTADLVIVGDTNMRLDEGSELFDVGFTGDKPPHPTWDSRDNRFRSDSEAFWAYFTRWFASPGLVVDDVVVHRTPVEFDDRRFHLSDHYALSGHIRRCGPAG